MGILSEKMLFVGQEAFEYASDVYELETVNAELLEALREAVGYFEDDYMRPDWLDSAEKAIATASPPESA